MPQYDAYEDPLAIGPTETATTMKHPHNSTGSSNQSVTGVHMTEPNNAAYYNINSDNNDSHSRLEYHKRHSHLERHPSQIGSCRADDPMSPKKLSEKEKQDLAEFEASQQEDDSIRMIRDTECANKKHTSERREGIPEFDKETHMLNGGWMHRSRGSCELLREHSGYSANQGFQGA